MRLLFFVYLQPTRREKRTHETTMAQKLTQEQTQKQVQVQRLSQQQMLQIKLLEMPLTQLEQSVMAELDDNPALEAGSPDDMAESEPEESAGLSDSDREGNEDYDAMTEREEREAALDDALSNIGIDDRMPEYETGMHDRQTADYEEIVYGDTTSFYDKLKEQMGETELTERQREIMEYLIGSLDDDGLLRKETETISDELAIYHAIDATPKEIEAVLHILQTFDPAGIGARSLQECLLLQIARREPSPLTEQMRRVITDNFEAFTKKHWDTIGRQFGLTDKQVTMLQEELRRLNPKPGAALGETQGRSVQQITPDFLIETHEDGTVSFSLNKGHLPELYVSPSFREMLKTYHTDRKTMSRQDKEALLYAKEKVERAKGFIEAVKQRRHTLVVTMQAIIDRQKQFFIDGDEADLRPMVLKDIADKTGLDISTISRVSNIKYAQTKWGTFPLRFFFTDGYTTEAGEELSTRKMKIALKELIDGEDKHRPMSDDQLKEEMKRKGFPIARRTVSKYREQLGVPVARLRRE